MKRKYGPLFTYVPRNSQFYKRSRKNNYRTPAMNHMRAIRRRSEARRRRNIRTAGFLGIEYKFLDCAWNSVTISSSTDGSSGNMQPSTGCTNCISCPAQGDGESQRDGKAFVLKSAWVSGVIETALAADQADVIENFGYFCALVLDTQANGATVTTANVYSNPSTDAKAILPQPLRNLQYSKRFKILDSKYVRPSGMYAGTDGASTLSLTGQNAVKVSLNWKGSIKVNTSGTTANVSSVTDNALHVIMYAGDTTLQPSFVGKSRVRFVG